jgi:hypothetical protein
MAPTASVAPTQLNKQESAVVDKISSLKKEDVSATMDTAIKTQME